MRASSLNSAPRSVRTVSRASRPSVGRASVQALASSRRDALLGGAVLLGSAQLAQPLPASADSTFNLSYVPVNQLGAFQKKDQRLTYQRRAEAAIMEVLTAEDAPAAVRLALLDAGDYDKATKAGGANGSIHLNPPSELKGLVAKLAKAKAAIDQGDKDEMGGPISWADLIFLAGKATTVASWKKEKAAQGNGAAPAGNEWPVQLGRVDSDAAGPNTVPALSATVEEVQTYMSKLGAKGDASGPFAPKPPFWEKPAFVVWTASAADPKAEEARFAAASSVYDGIKSAYDKSRATISRTAYETDFAETYNKLCGLGSVIDPDAYLHPEPILKAKL